MMEYKGYLGKFELDEEADLFAGQVVGLRDVITFQGKTPAELVKAFRDSVDDYLEFCASRGEKPDKPFSGNFIVRTDPEIHRRINAIAEASGQSLNAWVNDRIIEKANVMQMTRSGSAPKGTKAKAGLSKSRQTRRKVAR
jgi:predicted HicB family RNase H-like nuclease